jgi:NADPH-dependent 2,4-dienoyl-CoA reductase/sulfur reductase-like enzyme
MSPENARIVVVGAGVAGWSAAAEMAAHGLKVTLIDEHSKPGGQYLRSNRPHRFNFRLRRLLNRNPSGIGVRLQSRVLGIEPDRTLLVETASRRLLKLRPDLVLLATGAREKFWPFPGWTLPGVMATGAAQILVKNWGVLPGYRTVIAGRGFFPWTVAREVRLGGGRVPLAANESSPGREMFPPLAAWRHWSKWLRSAGGLLQLAGAGTRLQWGTRILEARGTDRLEEVVTLRSGAGREAGEGRRRCYAADALAVGHGFAPNDEIARLCGCKMVWKPSLGGWIVQVADDLESSREGIFAAGEITGIGGAGKSAVEGELAGLSIVRAVKGGNDAALMRQIVACRRARAHELAFARYLNAQFASPLRELRMRLAAIPDETVVCRCEDTRMGDVRRAVQHYGCSAGAVKKATRLGMGICQGSVCRPFLQDLLLAECGGPVESLSGPSIRFPLRPVSLGVLARGPVEAEQAEDCTNLF